MIKLEKQEQLIVQKKQEARNFVGKNGPEYVQHFATKEEKEYFEGILYKSGIPILALLCYLTYPINLY